MHRGVLLVAFVLSLPSASFARDVASRAPLSFSHLDFVWNHHNDCTRHHHPHYRDPRNGVLFAVESDGRHLGAVNPNGEILWRRNPHRGIMPYRVAPACVAALEPWTFRGRLTFANGAFYTQGKTGHYIELKFDNSQVGLIDTATGNFIFLGQN